MNADPTSPPIRFQTLLAIATGIVVPPEIIEQLGGVEPEIEQGMRATGDVGRPAPRHDRLTR